MPELAELLERVESGNLTQADIDAIPRDEFFKLAGAVQQQRLAWQMENQLLFYKPVSDEVKRYHASRAKIRVILGGNGSSKSEAQLVDGLIQMTGIIPYSLQGIYPEEKLRVPVHARLICESFTTTWVGSIKPKLIWNEWTGLPDGIRGHWGWIPKHLLKNGKWEDSWSAENRILKLTSGSDCQVFSHDQEVQKMASASIHVLMCDEGPTRFEWRENLMRGREGCYYSLAMTPPDDKSKSWHSAWVYDELYKKGLPGPDKDPNIESFTFDTRDNKFADQDAVTIAVSGMTEQEKATRLRGAFTHLGGLVYPTYTDIARFWCFKCNDQTFLVTEPGIDTPHCGTCKSTDTCEYMNYVEPDPNYYRYPIVFLMDPHPRKPIMMIWVAIDPIDDAAQVAEMEVDAKPEVVAERVFDFERTMGFDIRARVMDAKMGGQAAHNAGKRGVSVRDIYDQVGLRCKMADNDFMVGKNRLRNVLEPDRRTRRPRYVVFNTCKRTNFMFKHFVWDEWVNSDDKDEKQLPKTLNDDFPALARYYANEDYSYAGLTRGQQPINATRRKRKAAYG
jgi:hypothetical protein